MAETNDNNTTNGNSNANSWVTYQRLILANGERHETAIKELTDKIAAIDKALAVLQTKMLIIGAAAGLLVSGLFEIIAAYIKK